MSAIQTVSAGNVRQWLQALEALAPRNGTVELQRWGEDGHVSTSWPVRLLKLGSDGSLIVERPRAQPPVRGGEEVRVLVVQAGQRWLGRCVVQKVVKFQFTEGSSTVALQLGAAQEVGSGQRRGFFRADVSERENLEAALLAVRGGLEEQGAIRPEHAGVVPGQLLNVSAGGLGLRVEARCQAVFELRKGGVYRCRLRLPNFEAAEIVPVRVMHFQKFGGASIYLGLKFEITCPKQKQRLENLVLRFTTDVQREQLQERRARERQIQGEAAGR